MSGRDFALVWLFTFTLMGYVIGIAYGCAALFGDVTAVLVGVPVSLAPVVLAMWLVVVEHG